MNLTTTAEDRDTLSTQEIYDFILSRNEKEIEEDYDYLTSLFQSVIEEQSPLDVPPPIPTVNWISPKEAPNVPSTVLVGPINNRNEKHEDVVSSQIRINNFVSEQSLKEAVSKFSSQNENGIFSEQKCYQAIADCDRSIGFAPNNFKAYFTKGFISLSLAKEFRFRLEQQKRNQSATDQGVNSSHTINLMQTYESKCQKLSIQAIDSLKQSANINRKLSTIAAIHTANCFFVMDDINKSLKMVNDILEFSPDNIKALLLKGKILHKMCLFQKSAESLMKLPVGTVDYIEAQAYLLLCRLELKDEKKAHEHFCEILSILSKAYKAQSNKYVFFIQNLLVKLDICNVYPQAYFLLATTQKSQDNFSQAALSYKTFIDWHISNPASPYRCGNQIVVNAIYRYIEAKEILATMDEGADSFITFVKKIEKMIGRRSATLNYTVGKILDKCGHKELAFTHYELADQLSREQKNVKFTEAITLMHGIAQKAFESYREAVSRKDSLEKINGLLSEYFTFQERLIKANDPVQEAQATKDSPLLPSKRPLENPNINSRAKLKKTLNTPVKVM